MSTRSGARRTISSRFIANRPHPRPLSRKRERGASARHLTPVTVASPLTIASLPIVALLLPVARAGLARVAHHRGGPGCGRTTSKRPPATSRSGSSGFGNSASGCSSTGASIASLGCGDQPFAGRGRRGLLPPLLRGAAQDVQPEAVRSRRLGRSGPAGRFQVRGVHGEASLGLLHVRDGDHAVSTS